MHIGNRNIRSAGRGSGSVEITLPVDLGVLEGVRCHVELRDGLVPEIVLRPDLGFLLGVFEAAWARLAIGLETVGEIGGFSEADYVMGLFPETGLGSRPGLAYADGLLLQRQPRAKRRDGMDGRMRSLEAFARLIEAMATVAGGRLGLSIAMASLFGNQIAYTATGAPVAMIDAFARSSLAEVSSEIGWCHGDPFAEACWLAARPRLARLYERLADWDEGAAGLQKERENWYRARRVEIRVHSLGG